MNPYTLLLGLGLATVLTVGSAPPGPPSHDIEPRVEALLAQMTLEEKISLLSGDASDFNAVGLPRLGIPAIPMSDGPAGVRTGRATAFPAPINLAASWDVALAARFGEALAEETLAKGRACILGPCVGIHRFPLNGRNFESYGEDPWLSSRLAVDVIRGIQSHGVIATVKHFAVNDQEWERREVNALVDERTLREIHLPAFEAAVTEADVWAVMTSYNRINGPHASQCAPLINGILKGDWGFRGIVVSDWESVYSDAGAANAGLDLEMPTALWFGHTLLTAVRDGRVAEAVIDDKVRRHLRVRLEAGLFDRPEPTPDETVVRSEAHRALAQEIAAKGIVLLKNDGLLPLAPERLRRVALIGPAMNHTRTGGGGSSLVLPWRTISPLAGITALLAGQAEVRFEEGVSMDLYRPAAIPAAHFSTPDGAPGLRAEYFDNAECSGAPVSTLIEPNVFFELIGGTPDPRLNKDLFSIRWTGRFTPPVTQEYELALCSDDGSRLWLDGQLVIDHWGAHSLATKTAAVRLEAGRSYDVRVEFCELGGDATMILGWRTPGERWAPPSIEAAVAAARDADVAIVAVGQSASTEGEGCDVADFRMPAGQDELVRAVAATNPNTVVIVYGGVPQLLTPWIDRVRAVFTAFYPGQEGGGAIADLLFGRVAPSAKLPFSYIQHRSEAPAFADYRDPSMKSRYAEGVFVGYRYLDQNAVEPLFPFGHGLTYTTFAYSDLRITRNNDGVVATCTITNSGARFGEEVVQLYVAPPNSTPVPRPPQELKAFAKVALAPGESRTIELPLARRAFQYFDPDLRAWTAAVGTYEIRIGASSRDIRLRGTMERP
ncbi:MAG: glycoside hydrolase family 3 C-terminal domain-containing protein [Opitutaceae bacterium]